MGLLHLFLPSDFSRHRGRKITKERAEMECMTHNTPLYLFRSREARMCLSLPALILT